MQPTCADRSICCPLSSCQLKSDHSRRLPYRLQPRLEKTRPFRRAAVLQKRAVASDLRDETRRRNPATRHLGCQVKQKLLILVVHSRKGLRKWAKCGVLLFGAR